ncbi:hypothetical protein [Methanobrevibacter filiformis]|uniref:Uncharacterized protein n=1 Tax=Methanobrevibacter filiformis TaxID=55758 RepID=A0A162FNF1_9EURY|nr:hypothetical protein [Methanobrevibacter filiformis]KZX12670.1 hypothetical protein MBFIL_10700 [Methanobrevibacter filiformis]
MECRRCGFEFDEKKSGQSCKGCEKSNCNVVHCPNCGYGNSPAYEEEFGFIISLKEKLGLK